MKFIKKIKKYLLLILVIILSFIFYINYLNTKVKNIINSPLYRKPTLVYSNILNINKNSNIKKDELINALKEYEYFLVDKIKKPGEFCINNNIIKIFKRSFNFPDKYEKRNIFKIKFKNNFIYKIIDINNNHFNSIRIEPKIIDIIYDLNFNNLNKLFLPRVEFPKTLIDMIILIEDKNFYNHKGINIKSIFRAILVNIINMKIKQGGSTITQQLSKNLLLSNEKSFLRKINEMILSFIFEYKLNKKKIIELYLNEVCLGQYKYNKIIGFPLASLYFFGKSISEISIDEQATLVGMLKGPSLYNPLKNCKLTLNRRNLILTKFKNNNFIDNKFYKSLISRPIIIKHDKTILNKYLSFMRILNKEFLNIIKVYNLDLSKNQYKIFSTIDLLSQKSLQMSVDYFRKYKSSKIQIAAINVNKFNGKISSSIDNLNYLLKDLDRLNIPRQIGSIIKPILYLIILNKNIFNFNINSYVYDNNISILMDNKKYWNPKNFDNIFRGKVKLIESLIYSINIPYINIGMLVGFDYLKDFINNFNFNRNLNIKYLSNFIGSIYLSPIEVSKIYQSISNYGKKVNIYSIDYILDSNNNILYKHKYESKKIVPNQVSYLTMYSMQKVTKYGTSKYINNKFYNLNISSKTGTTNNNKDSWFVAITDNVFVSWIGNDNNKKTLFNGSTGPLILYKKYLDYIINKKINNINIPKKIYILPINSSGKIVCNKHIKKNTVFIPVWINNFDFDNIYYCECHNNINLK